MKVSEGRPWPLGVRVDPHGANVAVFSANATCIELCLFDPSGTRETARIALPGRSGDIHHGHVEGLRPGQLYGLRARGAWHPASGQRFNPAKLQLDPYAREVEGKFEWLDEHRGAQAADPHLADPRDNGAQALKARIVGNARFDWNGDAAPRVPLVDTVIYEMHVKGFSMLNTAIPPELRGSFAGLAHPASVAHLKRLGVTTLCLLPIHEHIDEKRLLAHGLVNYWGYNTIAFFCPDRKLASGQGTPRNEFRAMVKALHAAGLEVVLDVVYNHTAETEGIDAAISFQGLDNASYYRLDPAAPHVYENFTGCGNTVDLRHHGTLRLVMDSLRFWVEEMHVDGFRFDLASTLARDDTGVDRRAAFFGAIAQDPVLSRTKLIAEPWDLGPHGYQVGRFPRGWSEWNDRFRDDMRGYWLRGMHTRRTFAQRLCGSADLYRHDGRLPSASINYVVSHDGFTLRDLVSYAEKHNEANGEHNRDGTSNNLSVNCGVEGTSADPNVLALRGRLQRALLATTLLAQGIPMLSAGDELGHTQRGNNNPYCQDNEITWIDWARADEDLITFSARMIALRRDALPFADAWVDAELIWTGGDDRPLDEKAWNDTGHRAFGALIPRPGRATASLLLLFNASSHDLAFVLPHGRWSALLDSVDPRGESSWRGDASTPFPLRAHSVAVLREQEESVA